MRNSIVVAIAIYFVITVLSFASCGGGKHGGGLTSRLGANDTDCRGGVPPPASNNDTNRTLSIEQAIVEAREYTPPADVTSNPEFDPLVFEMLREEFIRQLEERQDRQVSATVATSDQIVLNDILVVPQPDGSNEVRFSEVLVGDYDSSGEVGISDITAIAQNYGNLVNDGSGDDALDRKIDGSGDGEVGIPDVTPIANNYLVTSPAVGSGSDGYDVWRIPADGSSDAELLTTVTESAESETGYGETRVFTAVDSDPVRGVSFVRRIASIDDEGEGYANGDYVYYISPHEDGSPDTPPQFAVTVEHQNDFRFAGAPASCQIVVKSWGELVPVSYTMDWGVPDSDYTPSPIETSDPLYQFTYTYTRPGIYFPTATVTGTVRGVTMSITQCAAPVIVEADVPYAPTGLSVSQLGSDVQLNWDVVDPTDHDGFRIYYSMKRGDSRPILLGETGQTANTFQTNLDNKLQYVTSDRPVFFKVTAFGQGDGVTVSELSSKFSNEFKYPDTSIPAPNPLLISSSTDDEVNLTWSAVASGAGYEVNGYRIYTTTTAGGTNPVLVSGTDPIPAGTTAFTYNTVDEDTILYFHAVTVASTGTSARSNEVYWARAVDPEAPVAVIIVDPLTGAPPLTVNFDASGSYDPDGEIVEYAWRFFSGDDYHDYTLESGIATHEYTDAGVYTAALRLIDDSGKRTYRVFTVIVNTPPTAVAGANPTKGTMPMTVNFDASGSSDPDGVIALYEWDFNGDGTYDWSNNENGNIQNVYSDWGDFIATLRVTDDLGEKSIDDVSIHVNALPVAVPNATPMSGNAPLTVNLDANGSYDPDGTIVKWEWDYTNDGTYDTSSTENGDAQYTYTVVGNNSAKHRITDDFGVAVTKRVDIHVNIPPIAQVQADPLSGDPALTVNFDAGGSSDPDGTVVKYEWDWEGDGTYDLDSGNDKTVSYEYLYSGPHNCVLRITDADGLTGTEDVSISVNYGRGDWYMFGRDPQHTHRSPYIGAQTNHVKWSYDTGTQISFSSPVITIDGTVIIGNDQQLYAFYPTGDLRWTYDANIGTCPCAPAAIGFNGEICIGETDGIIYMLQPGGTQKWVYATGDAIYYSSPTFLSNGEVIIGSRDKYVYAIAPNGAKHWSYLTGVGPRAGAAVDFAGNIIIGSYDTNLYSLSADGERNWFYSTDGLIASSACIGSSGIIYFGSYDFKLYAVNPDGSTQWSYPTEDRIFSSPAVGEDGTIYIGSKDTYVYAIYPEGTRKWRYKTGDEIVCSPSIGADGTVYIGSNDDKIYALTPDGSLKWSYQTGGSVASSPAIAADGTLYIGSYDGKLYAFGD